MSYNQKVSKKDFAALLGCDISDIVFDQVIVTMFDKDEEGNRITVGPSFASFEKMTDRTIQLVQPGRPEGTTVANGAKPKSPTRKPATKDIGTGK
jgi:hypothetical protein